MALTDETDSIAGQSYVVEILASAVAANSAPSGASAGVAVNQLARFGQVPDKIRIGIKSTAGSGTMTVTLRTWLYAGGAWFVAKAHAASSAAPQTAVAIAETGTDTIAFSEEVSGVSSASRIYLEIVAIAGVATAVTGYAIVGR